MEAQFESAQFDAELFSMANNTDFAKKEVEVWNTVDFIVGDDEYKVEKSGDNTVITLETAEALTGAKFYINGYTEKDPESQEALAAGEFEVGTSSKPTGSDYYATPITLGSTALNNGDEVIITYSIKKADQMEILVDNQSTFVGEMVLRWPRQTWAA